MSQLPAQSSRPQGAASTAGLRVRFIPGGAPANARIIHQFLDPAPATAVGEAISQNDPTAAVSSFDTLDVKLSADPSSRWLAQNDLLDAPLPIALKFPDGSLSWRPGRAILEGDAAWIDEALPILSEFAFYEAQLRKLEAALPEFESTAAKDIHLAYRPADQHRNQWDRLGKTIEQLAQLRLTFARLEPKLLYRSLAHKPPERRLFSRLCRAANTEDRLEAATNRLEACEDLYEGAIDRIRDHRWYRKGNLLETAIVVLLIIEVLQIAGELWLRIHAGK
jgi:hypothetical protein